MLIGFFSKTIVLFTALALIAFGVTPNATLGYLAKLAALDVGLSLLTLFVYPYVRGVRKGDRLIVSDERTPVFLFGFANAVATSDGWVNDLIQFELIDGTTGIGKVSRYEGIISNAEIKVMEKNVPIEIRG